MPLVRVRSSFDFDAFQKVEDARESLISENCKSQRYFPNPLTLALSAVLKMAGNPTDIFGEGVQQEKGENARLSAFVGAIAVGDLVKSTLGPKGTSASR